MIAINLKWCYLGQGRIQDAFEVMHSIPDEWYGKPGWQATEYGFAYWLAGDPVSAKPYLEKALSQVDAAPPELKRWDLVADMLTTRAYALAGLGRSDEAAAALRESLARAPRSRDEVQWATLAGASIGLLGMMGDMQGALELARQLVDPPTIHTPHVIWVWALPPLQANPEFRELMAKHGVDVTRDPRAEYAAKQASAGTSN
jgi:tetratricopeptide (TPR) repeat protein